MGGKGAWPRAGGIALPFAGRHARWCAVAACAGSTLALAARPSLPACMRRPPPPQAPPVKRWQVDAAVLKLHSRRCTCLEFHPTQVHGGGGGDGLDGWWCPAEGAARGNPAAAHIAAGWLTTVVAPPHCRTTWCFPATSAARLLCGTGARWVGGTSVPQSLTAGDSARCMPDMGLATCLVCVLPVGPLPTVVSLCCGPWQVYERTVYSDINRWWAGGEWECGGHGNSALQGGGRVRHAQRQPTAVPPLHAWHF